MKKGKSKKDKPLSAEERQSIVWTTIERIAFRPNPADTWIGLYERTIHKLWDLQPGDVPRHHFTEFQVPFLNITCEYHIEQVDSKYNASIHLAEDQSRFLLAVHVDPAYASKAALHSENRSYPSQDYARNLRYDVAFVLEGVGFYPRYP